MIEKSPLQNKNIENERLLRDAEHVINKMWGKANDVDDLPLSVDPDYQIWLEDLENRKNEFTKVLFNKARESTGENKLRSAQTLKYLLELLNETERRKLLEELMTTEKAVQKLVADAEQQVKSK